MKSAIRQRGLSTVEFAIAGFATLIVLFSVIEIGRLLYTFNTVAETTRRAARLAAVCPMNDPAIANLALMTSADGNCSSILPGLCTGNVSIAYLNSSGAAATTPSATKFVRVQISGYVHSLFFPLTAMSITIPPFTTTLPSESLGYRPELDARVCVAG